MIRLWEGHGREVESLLRILSSHGDALSDQ
jgi:hypothetical protein